MIFCMSKIFITSYPYAYERYFKVFDFFPEKERLVFILPKNWEAKGGKIKVQTPRREDIKIIPARAYFTHSHYPIIRGLFKGWMSEAAKIIRREARPGNILYTAIEPNLLTTFFNSRLAKKIGMKHVFFTWQNVPYKMRLRGLKLKFTEYIIKKTIQNSAGAICGNHKAAEILKVYAGSDFKILVAPISGVDVNNFKPGISSNFRGKYNLGGKIILLFSGVFEERKGIRTLLDSFLKASRENPDLHLIMVGLGPMADYIKKFIASNMIENKTTIISWLPNNQLPGVFADSDIFIYPSEPYDGWEEQFGFSMTEASAAGLPVISTRSGSIEEVVKDGETGILVEPKNIAQLRKAIVKLSGDPFLRKQMGQRGREFIVENFSHQVIANKFNIFFKSL